MKSWLAISCLILFSGQTLAEALSVKSIGDTVDNQSSGKRPSRGMSKAEVEKNFGLPVEKKEPVGYNAKRKHHRAITRWVYDDYMVIFDSNHVIVTVNRRK